MRVCKVFFTDTHKRNDSGGIKIMADLHIDEAAKQEYDCIALPGGMPGATRLRDSSPLMDLLGKHREAGKVRSIRSAACRSDITHPMSCQLYGAICAAPAVVLASKGWIGEGATGYPAEAFLSKMDKPSSDDVVVQSNVVTSKGPGTALKFGLALGEALYGKEKASQIAAEMLVEA